ncbi:hypothetical protein [Niabella sp.]|uniref:hypothetical protein n=1 Tax=Niabella sp. TaxID=1962976 RepID=UPI0026360E06|nr:hypothetical protein [Niabella sp.]
MNKSFLLLWLLLVVITGRSQDATAPALPSRMQASTPSYGLPKVKGLIDLEQRKYGQSFAKSTLPTGAYDSLSLQEKFTYAMIHPERYAQNCSLIPPQLFEPDKIFGTLITTLYEHTLSNRQVSFLKDNRNAVMTWITSSVEESKKMGVNYKNAITIIDGWELIPFMIKYYKTAKNDTDVLTTLMLLMKQGAFDAFTTASFYEQLYGKNSSYRSYVSYSPATEQLLLKMAMDYYKKKSAAIPL